MLPLTQKIIEIVILMMQKNAQKPNHCVSIEIEASNIPVIWRKRCYLEENVVYFFPYRITSVERW